MGLVGIMDMAQAIEEWNNELGYAIGSTYHPLGPLANMGTSLLSTQDDTCAATKCHPKLQAKKSMCRPNWINLVTQRNQPLGVQDRAMWHVICCLNELTNQGSCQRSY